MPWHTPPYDSSSSKPAKRQRLERAESPFDLFVAPYTPRMTEAPVQVHDESDAKIELVQEQQEALNTILEGKNVFLTGEAGSGKTVVLKKAIVELREQGRHVRVTAPTGKAACEVGGTTLHTLFGLTPKTMQMRIDELESRIEQREPIRQNLITMDVLVIDEISMVENIFFSRLNRIVQAAKDNDEPFGGAQIIVCGDFRQLPPVKPFRYCFAHGGNTVKKRSRDRKTMVWRCTQCEDENPESDQWAFRAAAWEFADFTNINLKHNHRQEEKQFVETLRKLAAGDSLDRNARNLLYHHPCDVEGATYLFPTNQEVRDMNSREFDRLSGDKVEYRSLDHFRWNQIDERFRYLGSKSPFDHTLEILHDHHYEPVVQLKMHQPVVLTMNLDVDRGLVNGSQGRIVGFQNYDEETVPRGSGLDHTTLETEAMPDGRSQSSSNIRGGDQGLYRFGKIKEFCIRNLQLPVVQFLRTNTTMMILPDCSLLQLGDEPPYTLLSRTQIPLIASWAMSFHKAQGMTMDKVTVDLTKTFCPGQAYVALSRAKKLSGLKVQGSDVGLDKAAADSMVKDFMKNTMWHIG